MADRIPSFGVDPMNAPDMWWDPGAHAWVIETDRLLTKEEMRFAMNDTANAQLLLLDDLRNNPTEFDSCAESILALKAWKVVQRIRAPETRPTIVTARR